jgi:hypothetical protein
MLSSMNPSPSRCSYLPHLVLHFPFLKKPELEDHGTKSNSEASLCSPVYDQNHRHFSNMSCLRSKIPHIEIHTTQTKHSGEGSCFKVSRHDVNVLFLNLPYSYTKTTQRRHHKLQNNDNHVMTWRAQQEGSAIKPQAAARDTLHHFHSLL